MVRPNGKKFRFSGNSFRETTILRWIIFCPELLSIFLQISVFWFGAKQIEPCSEFILPKSMVIRHGRRKIISYAFCKSLSEGGGICLKIISFGRD